MNKALKYAVAATTLASVVVPMVALAALTVPTPPIGDPRGGLTGKGITDLLENVARFVLTISVIIAVIVIVWGGIQALRGGWASAKDTLTKAAIGLAIIFGVGLIMQTIANVIQTRNIG